MTSHRKRKKTAAALGLGEGELALAEILEEVLEELRWTRILAYGNQYLLNRFVKIDAAERDRVIEAATRAVEKDGKLAEWKERAGKIKQRALDIKRRMRAEFAAGSAPTPSPAKPQAEVDAGD